ncbi:MAG: DUF4262 domain-containing protein [Caulobacterales bacterium]|nr:DUF4262 domain-containing protein [Caulobacterales bacterium]
MYVGDYRTGPAWGYTIGFDETLNQPEVIVFDVPSRSAAVLFEKVFKELRAGLLILEDGMIWPPGEPHACVWRKVHPSHIDCEEGWFTLALHRRARVTGKRFGLEAFQFVLSDNDGRLPWEVGYDEALRALQPALYLPHDAPAATCGEARPVTPDADRAGQLR